MSGQKSSNKVERALAAVSKKLTGKDDEADRVSTHSFKELYKNNMVPLLLESYKPSYYTLPNSIMLSIDVEFDVRDKDYDYLQSEGVAPYVQRKAQELVMLGLPPIVQKLRRAEGMVALGYIKEADFIAEVEDAIGELETKTCKEMGPLLEQAAKAFVKDKRRVRVFKLRAAGSVVKNVISIAGNAAHAGLSWGATSPLAIVLIARSCISIAQTIGEVRATANKMVALIDIDFKVFDTLIAEAGKSEDPRLVKARNDLAEIGLSFISAVTGLKTPSIKNCKDHINTYRVKITEFEMKVVSLGPKLTEMISANTALAKQIETMPVKVTADAIAKASMTSCFEGAAAELNTQFARIADLNGEIEKGHQAAAKYEERLAVLEKSIHKTLTEWTAVGFSLGIDAALGVNAPEEALEKGLEAIISLANTAMDVMLEKMK